ncbi:hypothetical protein F4780DRAFT_20037 [Xylariomycetidae sp. FL0641]|nr:hypothetical protein F4780DRAFT_20037 [Xylariomycetidae sp. FL0641]
MELARTSRDEAFRWNWETGTTSQFIFLSHPVIFDTDSLAYDYASTSWQSASSQTHGLDTLGYPDSISNKFFQAGTTLEALQNPVAYDPDQISPEISDCASEQGEQSALIAPWTSACDKYDYWAPQQVSIQLQLSQISELPVRKMISSEYHPAVMSRDNGGTEVTSTKRSSGDGNEPPAKVSRVARQGSPNARTSSAGSNQPAPPLPRPSPVPTAEIHGRTIRQLKGLECRLQNNTKRNLYLVQRGGAVGG